MLVLKEISKFILAVIFAVPLTMCVIRWNEFINYGDIGIIIVVSGILISISAVMAYVKICMD